MWTAVILGLVRACASVLYTLPFRLLEIDLRIFALFSSYLPRHVLQLNHTHTYIFHDLFASFRLSLFFPRFIATVQPTSIVPQKSFDSPSTEQPILNPAEQLNKSSKSKQHQHQQQHILITLTRTSPDMVAVVSPQPRMALSQCPPSPSPQQMSTPPIYLSDERSRVSIPLPSHIIANHLLSISPDF